MWPKRVTNAGQPPGVRLVIHITTVPVTLRFLEGHVRYQRAAGLWVQVISSPGEMLDKFAEETGAPCWPVAMHRGISPIADLVALMRLLAIFRRLKPDVVHAHTPKAGLLGITAGLLAGTKLRVYHIHGLRTATLKGLLRVVVNAAERWTCSASHRVLCVSHSLRDEVIAQGLCPPERISVPANGSIAGIDAEGRFGQELSGGDRAAARAALGIPPDAKVVGFVGRLVPDKGIAELYRAFEAIKRRLPAARLLLVGPAEAESPLPEALVEQFEGDERVHRLGWVDDLPSVYAAMDVLVLPSHREGFPVVLLEGAAMGLPIVATRIPGVIDAVVDGAGGTLVDVDDAPALGEAVLSYLLDPKLARAHGQAARRQVRAKFRPEPIFEETADVYRRHWDAGPDGGKPAALT